MKRSARVAFGGAVHHAFEHADGVQLVDGRDLINDIPALIEYLSGFMTLQAGDVILPGTPEGVVNVSLGARCGPARSPARRPQRPAPISTSTTGRSARSRSISFEMAWMT